MKKFYKWKHKDYMHFKNEKGEYSLKQSNIKMPTIGTMTNKDYILLDISAFKEYKNEAI